MLIWEKKWTFSFSQNDPLFNFLIDRKNEVINTLEHIRSEKDLAMGIKSTEKWFESHNPSIKYLFG